MTTDSEGLHAIANTTNPDRKADIVFVHGLAGGSHSTWRHGEEGKAGHFFWPEELGKELPDCGIWSLGYAAGISHWFGAPGMPIQERARNLVLKLLNRDLGERPLIFITHSMGGLEVKEIIVRSQTRGTADWKRLVSSIRGIVFCGTPHRGAHLASAANVLTNYLRTQKHLQQMEMGSPLLDTLHDEFLSWQRDTRVMVESYVERIGLFRTRFFLRPLPLGLVTPSESGNPSIAGCDCHPVSADHLTLVKPDGHAHDVYAGVLRFIRKVLRSYSVDIPPSTVKGYTPIPATTGAATDQPTHSCSSFLEMLSDKVAKQLSASIARSPLLEALALQLNCGQNAAEVADALIAMPELQNMFAKVYDAASVCLLKLQEEGDPRLAPCLDCAKAVFGWLVLRSVDDNWVSRNSDMLRGSQIKLNIKNAAVIEVIVSRVDGKPASWGTLKGSRLPRETALDLGDAETGFAAPVRFQQIAIAIWAAVFDGERPSQLTDDDIELLNVHLAGRGPQKKRGYRIISMDGGSAPSFTPDLLREIEKKLPNLRLILIDVDGHDGMLALGEAELSKEIYDFIKILMRHA